MSAMDNRDEVLQLLERFTRLKQKEIPRELEDYLSFVARTGDTVYPWAAVKYFFRTKLSHVIMDFHDNTPSIADLPQCPNVDPFCYDRMKRTLLSRMESFNSAPFTIQRICELLNEPRKHYTRIDKFMRAVEKNILVVSTQEPGRRRSDSENGDSLDSIVNGDLEVNVDIEMDNEAFGIDANEVAANAAAVAATVSPMNITTPAHAEEVPPTMEPAQEEQDSEKPLSDNEPKLATAEQSDVSDLKPEETLPSEVNGGGDKEGTETTEDDVVSGGKHVYSADGQVNSPESSALDHPNVEPPPDVTDSIAAVAHDEKELDEPLPADQPFIAAESTPESLETSEPPASSEAPVVATATEAENESVDDDEPKAKVAKLSQEEPEVDTIAPTLATEEQQPAAAESEAVESVCAAVVSVPTEELSESDVVSIFPSTESLQSVGPESAGEYDFISSDEPSGSHVVSVPSTVSTEDVDIAISSDEPSAASSVVSISSTVSTDSNSADSSGGVEEVSPSSVPEATPTEQIAHEAQPTAEATEPPHPSDRSEVVAAASVDEETVVKTIDLEVHPSPEEVPPEQHPVAAQEVNADDMETVPSAAAAPENVMATDEEEQQSHSGQAAGDTVVPMAADATEAASNKPDENAMDIDESSVEPMDQ